MWSWVGVIDFYKFSSFLRAMRIHLFAFVCVCLCCVRTSCVVIAYARVFFLLPASPNWATKHLNGCVHFRVRLRCAAFVCLCCLRRAVYVLCALCCICAWVNHTRERCATPARLRMLRGCVVVFACCACLIFFRYVRYIQLQHPGWSTEHPGSRGMCAPPLRLLVSSSLFTNLRNACACHTQAHDRYSQHKVACPPFHPYILL